MADKITETVETPAAPVAPVQTVAPEVKPQVKSMEQHKMVEIVLQNQLVNANTIAGYHQDTIDPKTGLTVPGEEIWEDRKYGPGRVAVPENIVEDLMRRDAEAVENDRKRLVGREVILDLGKIDGSGYDVTKL